MCKFMVALMPKTDSCGCPSSYCYLPLCLSLSIKLAKMLLLGKQLIKFYLFPNRMFHYILKIPKAAIFSTCPLTVTLNEGVYLRVLLWNGG